MTLEEGFQAAQNVYWWLPTDERSATSVYLVCHPLQLCTGVQGLLLLRFICHCRNSPACVMKLLSERMCFRASLFPMLSTQEIVSEPRMACSNNILLQTSQHSLHSLDVPASWAIICSGGDLWFEEDFTIIFFDMKTQEHMLHICVIASQDTFARHCSMSGCLYDQDSCITIGMMCLASNVFQALT